MARTAWHAHTGGGRTVVANGSRAWIGPASFKSADAFEPIPRELLPPGPLHCVATNGTHVVVGGGPSGPPNRFDEGIGLGRGEYEIVVIDLANMSQVTKIESGGLGEHIGIVSGHVIDWYWFAQGDLLGAVIRTQLSGAQPAYDSEVVTEHYDSCDVFGVHGDVIAGSTFYKGCFMSGPSAKGPVMSPSRRSTAAACRIRFSPSTKRGKSYSRSVAQAGSIELGVSMKATAGPA